MVWYGSMAVVAAAWLVVLVGVWVDDWDITQILPPLVLCGVLLGALRHSRWVRQDRGRPRITSAEEALKGYPTWW